MMTDKKKIINLTGHQIVIFNWANKIVIPADQWTRLELEQVSERIWEINWDIPLYKYSNTINKYLLKWLAPKRKNTIYVVSIVLAQFFRRNDFYIVANPIKTKEWKVIWCRWLALSPNLM